MADTHPAWTRPDSFGWYAAANQGDARLEVSFRRGPEVLSRLEMALDTAPAPVRIPWPSAGRVLTREDALVVRPLGGTASELSILVHRALSRQELYDLARGRGIEVGPGPKPQIHPSDDTEVIYIEEMPPEKWAELYDTTGKFQASSADWSRTQVGKAGALPVADGSQDFIFSSHVFEHLANPLGHLEHWHAKLRPGGVVLAVVPELTSTKDRYMRPCALEEILDEYEAGIMEPELRHYERNALRLGPRKPDRAQAEKLQARQESIHVHFYTNENMARLLQVAVDRLGYRGFRLIHARNHKDFYYILTR